MLIGGDWRSQGSDWLAVISPSTEEVVAEVRHTETSDIDLAVTAARTAFDTGPRPRMSPDERAEVILAAVRLLAESKDEVATLVTQEMGAPYSDSIGQQVPGALAMAKAFVRYSAEISRQTARKGRLGWAIIEQEPVGVVGAIIALSDSVRCEPAASLRCGPA